MASSTTPQTSSTLSSDAPSIKATSSSSSSSGVQGPPPSWLGNIARPHKTEFVSPPIGTPPPPPNSHALFDRPPLKPLQHRRLPVIEVLKKSGGHHVPGSHHFKEAVEKGRRLIHGLTDSEKRTKPEPITNPAEVRFIRAEQDYIDFINWLKIATPEEINNVKALSIASNFVEWWLMDDFTALAPLSGSLVELQVVAVGVLSWAGIEKFVNLQRFEFTRFEPLLQLSGFEHLVQLQELNVRLDEVPRKVASREKTWTAPYWTQPHLTLYYPDPATVQKGAVAVVDKCRSDVARRETGPRRQPLTETKRNDEMMAAKSNAAKFDGEKDKDDEMYIWGMNGPDTISIPKQVNILKTNNASVAMIACGSSHTVALTDVGHVYTRGEGINGALGHGNDLNAIHEFKRVSALSDVNIIQIACGSTYTVALSDSGVVYVWGFLRWFDMQFDVPYMVSALKRYKIVQVASGGRHILALTREGNVFSDSSFGRLGRDVKKNPAEIPHLIPELTSIQIIACGDAHSIAVSKVHQVFAWGHHGAEEKTGVSSSALKDTHLHISPPEFVPSPLLIEDSNLPRKPIAKVCAGTRFTLVLYEDGHLHIFGLIKKKYVADRVATAYPRMITGQLQPGQEVRFTDIAVGFEHALAISTKNEVYSWGYSIHGQTGHNQADYIEYPEPVKALKDIRVTLIAAGGYSSLAFKGMLRSILGADLITLCNNKDMFPDVKIVLDDASTLVAHSFILSCRSPVFRAQLQENSSIDKQGGVRVLHIADHEAADVLSFLEFVYSDRLSRFNSLPKLAALAEKYKMQQLLEMINGTPSREPALSINVGALLEDDKGEFGMKDVEFRLPTGSVWAHKAILCARSIYFRTMFERKLKESQSNVIELSETSFGAVSLLLQFLYTDKVEGSDVNAAIDLLPLTDQYQLHRLKNMLQHLIEREVDEDSVLYVWKLSKLYNATRLSGFCENFIALTFKKVQQSDFWQELSEEERASLTDTFSIPSIPY